MIQLTLLVPLASLLIADLFISGVISATFTITNKCKYTVWPGIATDEVSTSSSPPTRTGFSLQMYQSENITIPAPWTGRLWGRTYCQNSTGKFSCVTGDCGFDRLFFDESGEVLQCSDKNFTTPTTLAEFQIGVFGGLDIFFVSLVGGFNLPLLVQPRGGSDPSCSTTGCAADLNDSCPLELRVKNGDGSGVGCRSPCDVNRVGLFLYCCEPTYSVRSCKPARYSQLLKTTCPRAYSYIYNEEPPSTFTCKSTTDYLITFCPDPSSLEGTDQITPGRNWVPIIAGLTGAGAIVIIPLLLVLILRIRPWSCTRSYEKTREDDSVGQVPGMLARFSYEDLCIATNDFKERLGRGGFGSVFKGVMAGGTEIAVKRLENLRQGKSAFLAEVETIGSLHHFNLVRLIGFCAEKSHRLLVYEYMSNGSLDNWIFKKDQTACLAWKTRKKVILDVAKGLAYLHEDCRQTILHLDIKPQNILLDPNFNAKISDFGLSKLIDRDLIQIQIPVMGTPGYLAPDWYRSSGHITVKVDIYSFGIVLLEIVCGRRNIADHSQPESGFHLLRMLQEKGEQDRLMDIVEHSDENMQDDREEMLRIIKIGAWCLQDEPERRPSMSTVVKVLEGVMEVDSNLVYRFSHSLMTSFPVVPSQHTSSVPPLASVLSNPR